MHDTCVIFNPAAGKKRAGRRLQKLQTDWARSVDFLPTQGPGHAVELARQAAQNGYRVVTAAGGDGTVHEVVNGLLLAQRPEVRFAIIPIGSANDFAYSLDCHRTTNPGTVCTVDAGVVRDPTGRKKEEFFICCLGLGFNGNVTLESRKVRRLQGMALYGLATLRALWYHYSCPAMEVTLDDGPPQLQPTLSFSALLGRREGGFVLAPEAKLDDGLFDFVHAGDLSRLEVLAFLPRLALWGAPKEYPKVRLGRCRRVQLKSPEPLTVHLDGEFFARPEDNIRAIDISILPAALKVRNGPSEPEA